MNQFFGEIERKKDVEREKARHYTSLAIGAFAALATVTIVIITQKLDNFIVTRLLILMLFVLILGFWGKSAYQILKDYTEKRRYDKLAKSHFGDFKTLVIRFGDLTANWPSNIQTIMKDTKSLPQFSQITGVEPIRIQELYKYYNKHLDHFNGTGDGLIDLVKEFESILYMYDDAYIKEPIKQVKNIGSDKVPKYYIESYNKAQTKYTAFLMDYNAFAKTANEDFKENLAFQGKRFQDTFEPPEDL